MPYSYSLDLLEANLDLLQELQQNGKAAWRVQPSAVPKFMQKMRDCLATARLHSEKYPQLAEAADGIRLKHMGNGLVIAQPTKESKAINKIAQPTAMPVTTQLPTSKHLPPEGSPEELGLIVTPDRVISELIAGGAHMGAFTHRRWEHASLSQSELETIYQAVRRYGLVMLYTHGEFLEVMSEAHALRLTQQTQTDILDLAWSPEGAAADELLDAPPPEIVRPRKAGFDILKKKHTD